MRTRTKRAVSIAAARLSEGAARDFRGVPAASAPAARPRQREKTPQDRRTGTSCRGFRQFFAPGSDGIFWKTSDWRQGPNSRAGELTGCKLEKKQEQGAARLLAFLPRPCGTIVPAHP